MRQATESKQQLASRGPLRCSMRSLFAACTLATMLTMAAPARAVDGCQVLLCLAAPKWRDIPMCVPTIQQLMRDLARGRPFPVCGMSGRANTASHDWSNPPIFCPPQYTRVADGLNGPIYDCDYAGAVTVKVEGVVWARTWWNMAGETVTEFSPAAKAKLGAWDTKFDDDYAAWLAAQQPPPALPCPAC